YLLQGHSVRDTAAHLGCSERYLRALFTPQVGLSPKAWHRLQRFRYAANRLHRGDEIRWEALALQCGYYDQAHFANEFRAFSGIDPTTYSRAERPWASHITE
ncbi:MAG: AraC family transcriptional regulator, partial [Terriglobus sp.]